MNAERWRRVKALYHSAADRPPGERGDFLAQACGEDQGLRREIESMLHRRGEKGILDEPLHEPSGARPELKEIIGAPLIRNALRVPLWLYLIAGLTVLRVGLTCVAEFYSPEAAGWVLQPAAAGYVVVAVAPDTPAGRAGMRRGDRILRWDGIPFNAPVERFAWRTAPNSAHVLRIERGLGQQSVLIAFGLRSWRSQFASAQAVSNLVTIVTALLSAAVGLFIAWSRPRDWVALGFAWSMFGVLPLLMPDGFDHLWLSLPWLLMAALHVHLFVANVGIMPLLVAAILNFPRRLPGWPWYLPVMAAPLAVNQWFFVSAIWRQHLDPSAPGWGWLTGRLFSSLLAVYLAASFAALVWKYRSLTDPNERRRVRLLFAGIVLGVVRFFPDFAVGASVLLGDAGNSYYSSVLPVAFSFFGVPIPFLAGIAILRHRVFDIRVLIRQSLQYAAARRLLLGAVPLCGAALGLDLLLHGERPLGRLLAEREWWYIALACAALVAHWKRSTWLSALDRRFFREHYDAHRVLSALVKDIRHCSEIRQISQRMVTQIDAALHPQTTVLLLRKAGETRFTSCASAGARECPELPATSRIIERVRSLQKPQHCGTSDGGLIPAMPHDDGEIFRDVHIEWIFPIVVGDGRQEAVLALGPKRSEEPYSQDDRRLLESLCDTVAVHLAAAPVPKTPDDLLAGRYLLARCLGRGGMGTVYEALDTQLDRRVAIKLVRDDLIVDPRTSARFVREARNTAALCHPNVVTIYDYGVAGDGRAYLVMELLEGLTLRQELRTQGRMAPHRVLAILRNICSALEAAHSRGLIHRDLKPENVLLTCVADIEVAKILDFGIAKSLAGASGTLETDTGFVLGTPGYIPPENLRGAAANLMWDVWALGIVAYEALTGAFPFSTNLGDWSVALVPQALGDGAPRWDQLFARALAVDPARRPASAAEFLSDFERAMLPAAMAANG